MPTRQALYSCVISPALSFENFLVEIIIENDAYSMYPTFKMSRYQYTYFSFCLERKETGLAW
jgi:hypothetical protein